jgi:hypothetical protein
MLSAASIIIDSMSDSPGAIEESLARLAECVDEVLAMNRTAADLEDLRRLVKGVESQLTRLGYAQLLALAELDQRNIVGALQLRGLPDLLVAELRCTRSAAKAKANAMERLCPKHSLTGELIEAPLPRTASAVGAGEVNFEHATVITAAVESLPDPVRAERGGEVEATLVEHARAASPRSLKLLADRIAAHLDPDGAPPTEVDRQQHSRRRLLLWGNGDGTGDLSGSLSPACQAIWQTVFAALANQRPDDALGPDTRTQPQRMHDAFEEAGRRLLAAGKLPNAAGLASTLIVTIDLRDLESRIGTATTHHGGRLSVDEALRIAADGALIPAVLGGTGEILDFGRGRRLASRGQRRALFARDRGCTFPGCPKPAAQSEVHHTTEWIRGGRTDLGSLAIVCGYHNNEAPRQGWQTVMIDGIPHWRPPSWHDPQQRPRRNYLHHPELIGDLLSPAEIVVPDP